MNIKQIIIGLVILLSIGNVSGIPIAEHINWDCDQFNTLQTGDINWVKTTTEIDGSNYAYPSCSTSNKITEDGESLTMMARTNTRQTSVKMYL